MVLALAVVLIAILALAATLLLRGGDPEPAPPAPATGAGPAPGAADPASPAPAAEGAPGVSAAGEITLPPAFDGLQEELARRDPGDPMALGAADAPVVLVLFSDLRCPYCGEFSREIEPDLVAGHVAAGRLRLEWRDLPTFGEGSRLGARAGRAAAAQGRFWEFTAEVFAAAPRRGHPELDEELLVARARAAGIGDIDRFRADLRSARFDAAIDADVAQAGELGIFSTPSYSVGDLPVAGLQPREFLEAAIADQLAARG
ncbi:hypothetical protein CSPHI_10120 [Corynebacterium sphenisci DSM 44792]|uniref:Thioredoxin domain-containing protein n=1 Tax=Corynebacterium sphenisci DSM 44792 TaxID=1437874 RepID=A0A1L7CZH5_9CORY|nr:hypothetical protein CSPHI_10120 [Corynebacterium sphenisci DSM 44792]